MKRLPVGICPFCNGCMIMAWVMSAILYAVRIERIKISLRFSKRNMFCVGIILGHTPLYVACERNHPECMAWLLSHGSNVSEIHSHGKMVFTNTICTII